MAETVHVAGACAVKIAVPSVASGALQLLGYNRNMAEVTKEPYFLDVPGDQNGGDDGPPIDIIYLGETARIRLEMTKYDDIVANVVRARIDGGTAGVNAAVGSLMFSAANTMRLLLDTPNAPRNFVRTVPRGAIEVSRGTKFSTLICEFIAYKDASGVLYNAVTT